jgi:hypothetical protein
MNSELKGMYKETILMGNKILDVRIILKWYYKEIWEGVHWIYLALNRNECQTVMKISFPQKKP